MNPSSTANDWSDELKEQTRNVLEGRGTFVSHDGRLCLKHITSGFGTIAQEHLWSDVLKVIDRRTGAETCYTNVDELIAAGWVID